MTRSRGLVAGVLVAALVATAATPSAAQTQSDLNAAACAAYQQADGNLNAVYKKILQKYKADAPFLASLRDAQRAWIAYRDAHLQSVYPEKDKRTAYGSIYDTCACGVLRTLTVQRTAMLQAWLDGVPEGEVCAGSIQVKP